MYEKILDSDSDFINGDLMENICCRYGIDDVVENENSSSNSYVRYIFETSKEIRMRNEEIYKNNGSEKERDNRRRYRTNKTPASQAYSDFAIITTLLFGWL